MWDLMEFSPPNTTWQLEHLVATETQRGVSHGCDGGGGGGRGGGDAPVADAPGKVQAGLLQVGLEAGLPGHAAALGANVRRPVLVDPLVGRHGARVGQHHGGGALRARLGEREGQRALTAHSREVLATRTGQKGGGGASSIPEDKRCSGRRCLHGCCLKTTNTNSHEHSLKFRLSTRFTSACWR